ncbi:MAG: TonB-dependent receptor [Cellvibrionaceae bacterium]|nr:TonB-dependent receptor [Cellvibrionaceae bacterium]
MISSRQKIDLKSQRQNRYPKKPLARLIAHLLVSGLTTGLLVSPPSYAQEREDSTKDAVDDKADAAVEEMADETFDPALQEEVFITGIRASQRGAIDIKKQAGTMVDAIVAEDVSKFPDKNVTEALQRVTGVQISRDFGEGAGVNIRGMESGLNRIEFDGVSALGDAGRGVNLTDTASELIASLTVFKGSEARITEGGIGGTIQVELRKPNDFDEHFFSFALENIYNDLSQKYSPKVNVTGVYKFNEDMGVMLNFNFFDRHTMIHALRNTAWNSWADYDNSPEKTFNDPDYNAIQSYQGCEDKFGLNAQQEDDNGDPLFNDNGDPINGDAVKLDECQTQWWDFGPTNPRYGNWSRDEKRISANIGYGWNISDNWSVFTDYTYNVRDRRATDYNLSVSTDSEASIDRDSVIVDHAHNIRAFTTANANINNRTLKFDWEQVKHFGKIGSEYIGDKLELSGLVSYSEASQDIDSRDVNVSSLGVSGIRFVLDEKGAPEFDISSGYRYQSPNDAEITPFQRVDINDPAAYNGRIQYKYAPVIQKQKENSAKFDFAYNLDSGKFFTKARSGFRYAMRSLEGQDFDSRITFDIGLGNFSQQQMTQLLTGRTEQVPRFYPNFDLGVSTLDTYQALDPDRLIPEMERLGESPIRRNDLSPRSGAYYIEEKSYAGYLQVDFEQYLGSLQFWGNLGVRVVQTDLETEGDIVITSIYDTSNQLDEQGNRIELVYDWDGVPNSPVDINAQRNYAYEDVTNGDIFNPTVSKRSFEGRGALENSYTDVLPSLNLNLALIPDELILFTGMSKVMSRPAIDTLNINATCNRRQNLEAELRFNRNNCDAGNPYIDPYRATQFDLALNWYPNQDSLISAAYFTKKLTNYVQSDGTTRDVDFFAGTQNGGELYDVSGDSNITGVTTKGIEFQVKTVFSFLPGILANTGIDVNYTYMTAEDIPYRNILDGSELPLLGQSENSYNLSAFYEDDNLTIRVAYNYRDEFLGTLENGNRGNPLFVDSAGFVDAKISYAIGNSGFTVFADARNLLAEVKLETAGENRFTNLEWAGREFAIGFSYKM